LITDGADEARGGVAAVAVEGRRLAAAGAAHPGAGVAVFF
jgi:hypothetical protein